MHSYISYHNPNMSYIKCNTIETIGLHKENVHSIKYILIILLYLDLYLSYILNAYH